MRELMPFVLIGLTIGSIYGLAAMGLVLSYKTSGIFNFAYGAIAATAAGCFYELHVLHHLHWVLSAVVTVGLVGVILGLLMERIAHVLGNVSMVMKVAATIGVMVSLVSVFQLRLGTEVKVYPPFLPQTTFQISGVYISYSQIIVIAIGVLAVAILIAVLRFSVWGRENRAAVDNSTLLELSGRSLTKVRRRAWIISTTIAAVSGLLIAPSLGLDAWALTILVIQSFGAAAIGRFVNLGWAYVGGLGIGVIGAVLTKYETGYPFLGHAQSSLPFIVLMVVLVFIFGRRGQLKEVGSFLEERYVVSRRAFREGEGFRALVGLHSLRLLLPLTFLAIVPFIVGPRITYWATALVFVIIFLSLSLLVRTANQLSLCHMIFAAIGAVAFYHLLSASVPWLLALLLAGLVVAPFGALLAIPALRLSGLFLALVTLGFGIFVEYQIFETYIMFGDTGTSLTVPRPPFASTIRSYYYVILAGVVAVYALLSLVERGQLGRLLRARADSPVALACLGAEVRTCAIMAFSLSAVLAGIAGALMAPIFMVVGRENFTTFPTSVLIVVTLVWAQNAIIIQRFGSRKYGIGPLGVAVAAGIAHAVIPSYIRTFTIQSWLNLGIAVGAIEAAMLSNYYGRKRAAAMGGTTDGGSEADTPVPRAPDDVRTPELAT